MTVAEVAPEGATGGPIGKVRSGDRIVIDVPAAELAARSAPSDVFPIPAKGYLGIYRCECNGAPDSHGDGHRRSAHRP